MRRKGEGGVFKRSWGRKMVMLLTNCCAWVI